jgi:hypothetical protein
MLCLGLLAALACAGQTVVSQSHITGAGGRLASGYIVISAETPFSAADGVWVDTGQVTVRLVNGAFSVNLEPADTASPAGVNYRVTWNLDGARPRSEEWSVPTSPAALGVGAVVSTAGVFRYLSGYTWSAMTAEKWAAMTAPLWSGLTR